MLIVVMFLTRKYFVVHVSVKFERHRDLVQLSLAVVSGFNVNSIADLLLVVLYVSLHAAVML